jgi:hypothetical protein
MNKNKLKPSGIMLSSLIIILSFVYAINIQPKVIGDSENLKEISKVKIGNRNLENPISYDHKYLSDDEIPLIKNRWYSNAYNNDLIRLFCINNFLQIISNYMIKMYNLRGFNEINTLSIG